MILKSRPGLVLVATVFVAVTWLAMTRLHQSRDAADAGQAVPKSPRFEKPRDALFTDDFSSADLSGWKADQEGVWKVERGVLRGQLPDEKQKRSFLRAGDP